MRYRLLQQTGQKLFVAIVAAFIFADAIISIRWLLPVVCSGINLRLQQIAGVYTAAVVVSNFSVSVLCSPGKQHAAVVAIELPFTLACLNASEGHH